MEKTELSKVWAIIGTLTLYLTINIWSKTQGWGVSLPNILSIDKSSYTASIYGIIICTPLLILLLIIGRSYALQFGGDSWVTRIPPVFVKVSPNSKEGRFVRGALFLFIIFIPTFGQGHFFVKFVHGTAYHKENSTTITREAHFVYPEAFHEGFKGNFRYGVDCNSKRKGKKSCVDYFPYWQPRLFLLIGVVVLFLFISASCGIFFGKDVRFFPAAGKLLMRLFSFTKS